MTVPMGPVVSVTATDSSCWPTDGHVAWSPADDDGEEPGVRGGKDVVVDTVADVGDLI